MNLDPLNVGQLTDVSNAEASGIRGLCIRGRIRKQVRVFDQFEWLLLAGDRRCVLQSLTRLRGAPLRRPIGSGVGSGVEMEKLRGRRSQLERIAKDIERREQQQTDRRAALEHLEEFCREVSYGLDAMTFEERQQLLRLVVERITVEDDRVRIETVIPADGDDVRLRAHRPEPVEGRARRWSRPDALSSPPPRPRRLLSLRRLPSGQKCASEATSQRQVSHVTWARVLHPAGRVHDIAVAQSETRLDGPPVLGRAAYLAKVVDLFE